VGGVTIRVVVAVDHPLNRGGISALLDAQQDITVVSQAGAAEDAVKAVAEHLPDVVLLDLRTSEIDPIDIFRQLVATGTASCPPRAVRVVAIISGHTVSFVVDALRAGACGLVLADAGPRQLIGAVRAGAAKGIWLDPDVARDLLRDLSSQPVSGQHTAVLVQRLTDREREVLELMAHGLDNAEIARRLFISGMTVRTHVARVLHKLGCGTRTRAVVMAYRSGLVRVEPAA
jgi:DNA-binding NarL/FixJ family response regulator